MAIERRTAFGRSLGASLTPSRFLNHHTLRNILTSTLGYTIFYMQSFNVRRQTFAKCTAFWIPDIVYYILYNPASVVPLP